MTERKGDIRIDYTVYSVSDKYGLTHDTGWYEYILKLYRNNKLKRRYNSLLHIYTICEDKRMCEKRAHSVALSLSEMLEEVENPEKWFDIHGT
jgi:hypothetical protein